MKTKQILLHYEQRRGKEVADPVRLSIIVAHLNRAFGHLNVEDITLEHQDKYAFERPVSPSTIRRELGTLVAAVNFAVKTRLITQAQIPCVILPRGAEPKDLWLTEKEVRFLVAKAVEIDPKFSSRVYRFVMLALETASRKSAIVTLRWDQVDLEQGIIHFGKGERKTKKRRVPVPISKNLMKCLVHWKSEAMSEYVLDSLAEIDWGFERLIENCAEENPKFKGVTPHTLRHTWATLAARAGVDLWKIAGVLGDNLATVEKNYLHHCPDHLRDAVNFREVVGVV